MNMQMNSTVTEAMGRAFRYVRDELYCPGTGLLYDHRVYAMSDLPTPEEACRAYPNPAGYGTGMEDSVINTAGMIDVMIGKLRHARAWADIRYLHDLVNGLCLTAEAGKDGFLPRSRTPRDGKSHYPDSSRDQYTLFLYATHRYLSSGEANGVERGRLRRAVIAIADRAVRNVKAENGYDLLREDGGRSICTQMWGESLLNHEVSRLPMIYLSAWRVCGDDRYLEKYREIRAEAYQRLLPMTSYWHLYCLAQMQMSLAVLADLDPDEGWREKYRAVMRAVAEYAVSMIPKVRETLLAKPDFEGEYRSFRDLELVSRTHPVDGDLPNLVPVRPGFDVFFDLQDAANILFIVCIAGARDLVGEPFVLMSEAVTGIDFETHKTGAPVQFLEAYYAWRERFL